MTLPNRPAHQPNVSTVMSKSKVDPSMREYLNCLVNPKENHCRLPDGTSRNTSLYVSKRFVDVNVRMDAAGRNGSFATLVRPTLGSASDPQFYQVAQVETKDGWPDNLDDKGSFRKLAGGSDLRMDPNTQLLTQPPPSQYFASSTPTGSRTGNNLFTDVIIPGQLTTGGSPAQLSTNQWVQYKMQGGIGKFQLPLGQYICIIEAVGTSATFPASTNISVGLTGGVAADGYDFDAGQTATVGTYYLTKKYALSIRNLAGTEAIWFNVSGTFVPTDAKITLIGAWFPEYLEVKSTGTLGSIRPVAMSVYFRCDLSLADNAGTVSMVPIGAAGANEFFKNSTGENQPADWNYASKVNDAYTGRLEHGAYGWWSFENAAELEFRTIDNHVLYPFSGLVVSGQYTPTLAQADLITKRIGQLEICMVFEGVDDTTLFNKKNQLGSRSIVDDTRNLLTSGNIPRATSNDKHLSVIKKVVSLAGEVGRTAAALAPLFSFF